MHCRILAGKHGGVRWRRQRRLRDGILEQDTALRKPVEYRRFDFLITVAVEMVAPQGVKRDDYYVERLQPHGSGFGCFSIFVPRSTGRDECRCGETHEPEQNGTAEHRCVYLL